MTDPTPVSELPKKWRDQASEEGCRWQLNCQHIEELERALAQHKPAPPTCRCDTIACDHSDGLSCNACGCDTPYSESGAPPKVVVSDEARERAAAILYKRSGDSLMAWSDMGPYGKAPYLEDVDVVLAALQPEEKPATFGLVESSPGELVQTLHGANAETLPGPKPADPGRYARLVEEARRFYEKEKSQEARHGMRTAFVLLRDMADAIVSLTNRTKTKGTTE